jgi:CDP-diacylglycerol--glycerol-3-phosphate 3-phosphatidyltransferase
MDRTDHFLCGKSHRYAGWKDRQSQKSCNQFRKVYPLADKLLVCSAMICMIPLGKLQAWFVIVIIAREFIISGFRLVAADNDIVIAASYWGKFKTVSQMFMLILLIADFGGAFNMIAQVLIWVSLVLTIVSLIDYIAKNVQVLTQGGM